MQNISFWIVLLILPVTGCTVKYPSAQTDLSEIVYKGDVDHSEFTGKGLEQYLVQDFRKNGLCDKIDKIDINVIKAKRSDFQIPFIHREGWMVFACKREIPVFIRLVKSSYESNDILFHIAYDGGKQSYGDADWIRLVVK